MIAFISDLHLTAENKQSMASFRQFLEQLQPKVSALYILGDLFEFWVGDDAAVRLGYGSVIQQLRTLSQSGVELFFIPGNRDFLIAENFAQQTGCQLLADGTVITIHGTRVLLMHGDSLCTDDVEHQKFRHMVNQASWQGEFLARPQSERILIAKKARQQSQKNQQHKTMEILDVNQATVDETMGDFSVRLLIHGHTHRPAIHDWMIQGISRRRIVLGAWYTGSSVLLLSAHQLQLTPGPISRPMQFPEQ